MPTHIHFLHTLNQNLCEFIFFYSTLPVTIRLANSNEIIGLIQVAPPNVQVFTQDHEGDDFFFLLINLFCETAAY